MIKLLHLLINRKEDIGMVPLHAIKLIKYDPMLDKYISDINNIKDNSLTIDESDDFLLDSPIIIGIDMFWLKSITYNYCYVIGKYPSYSLSESSFIDKPYITTLRSIYKINRSIKGKLKLLPLYPSYKLFTNSIILMNFSKSTFIFFDNNITVYSKHKQYILEYIFINRHFNPF